MVVQAVFCASRCSARALAGGKERFSFALYGTAKAVPLHLYGRWMRYGESAVKIFN
jgi:hypothetical protein